MRQIVLVSCIVYLAVVLLIALAVIAGAMIAVAIVREILKPGQPASFFSISLGSAEFRVIGGYFGVLGAAIGFVLVLAIFCGIVYGLLSLGGEVAGGIGAVLVMFAALFGCGALIYGVVRLGFLITPSAVIEGGFGLKRSWALAKGNFWRIFEIGLSTNLPIGILAWIVTWAILNLGLENSAGEQMRQMAERWPLAVGFNVLLLPLRCGLACAPAAFAYCALMAQQKPPA